MSARDSFDFPAPPDVLPDWAIREAGQWRRKNDFDIEILAERRCPYQVEIRYVDLPKSVWGLHVARAGRARLCVNALLPAPWRRFALFHELYHLISREHDGGENFWRHTFQPLSKFESEADMFAWAVVLPEWNEDGWDD